MNRKTFLTSILAGIGLAVKAKEIAVSAGGGGNDRLIGSGRLTVSNYDMPVNGWNVTYPTESLLNA